MLEFLFELVFGIYSELLPEIIPEINMSKKLETLVYIVACVLTWDKWYSVLPLIAMLLTTVSNWFQSEKKIRFLKPNLAYIQE